MKRAVFLDRDGTLIEEKHYLHRPEDAVLLPNAACGLRLFSEAGFLLFLITNQSGVGRGYFPLSAVHAVNRRLLDLLAPHHVRIHGIYIAPEAPDQPSRGRKPSPQFLFEARDEFQIDLGQSCMIGDKLVDLECGWNAGVQQSILVRTGYGAQTEREHPAAARRALVVDDLGQAAREVSKLKGPIPNLKSEL